jgi:hypothetical protein
VGAGQDGGAAQRFVPGGTPAVLLFTDPRCRSCQQAIANLEQVTAQQPSNDLRILAVTDGDPDLIAASDAFAGTTLPVGRVHRRVVTTDYRSHKTPLLYGIDATGVIRAKEPTSETAAVRRLLRELRDQPPEPADHDADHHHAPADQLDRTGGSASKQEVHAP